MTKYRIDKEVSLGFSVTFYWQEEWILKYPQGDYIAYILYTVSRYNNQVFMWEIIYYKISLIKSQIGHLRVNTEEAL